MGSTTTVAVAEAPRHPSPEVGVIVKATVTGDEVVLDSVPLISPVPLAAIPVTVPVLFLVHAKVVAGTVLLKTTVLMPAPEQMVCEAGVAKASGLGLTVTDAVDDTPIQPFAVGVIVNVTVTGDSVVFVKIPLISPDPLAAIPVMVPTLSLVQPKLVEGTEPLNAIVVIFKPEQMVCDAGAGVTSGTGWKLMVAAAEFVSAQTPLFTTALYMVTSERLL